MRRNSNPFIDRFGRILPGGKAVATALLACLVAAPLAAQQASTSGLGVECDVYRALLDTFRGPFKVDDRAFGEIRFSREGVVRQTLPYLKADVDSSLVASYFANNADALADAENPGKLHPACFQGRRSTTFGGGDRTGSEERAVVRFSRVGFTPDLQRALVHTVYSCGPRCATGTLWLLEKEQGRWVVRESVLTVMA